jgi:hypothetical protein
MVMQIQFDPAALTALEANAATPGVIDFGTIISPVYKFDDTTEEYINGRLEVPAGIDGSGTVTFRAFVSPATGAASKNVALTLGHRPVATSEAIDGAYTDEDSGDKAITATTGNLTVIEWTETVANLDWVAEDLVFFRFSRPQASANNLVGDMYLVRFTIDIPEA